MAAAVAVVARAVAGAAAKSWHDNDLAPVLRDLLDLNVLLHDVAPINDQVDVEGGRAQHVQGAGAHRRQGCRFSHADTYNPWSAIRHRQLHGEPRVTPMEHRCRGVHTALRYHAGRIMKVLFQVARKSGPTL